MAFRQGFIHFSVLFIHFASLAFGQLSVTKFGAIPDDTLNDRDAIQRAINYCKTNNIKKLVFPAGKYRIREAKAIQLMQDVMDGKMGRNPQDVVFTPYYPYTRGIHLKGINGLEIVAHGAQLAVEGWMEPVSIENCKNLTINGLTIDYETMPHSEGIVVNEGDDFFDVRCSSEFPIRNNLPMLRLMFWDLSKNRLLGKTIYFPKKNELIDAQTIRIWASHSQKLLGHVALINHMFHFRPAILINESVHTVLNQVTIHAQPGMGIVGHRSDTIVMNGLRIVPRPGRYQSTNTDATHFTSCKGTVRFDGCTFEGQGDDATNVHGYYQLIKKKLSPQKYVIEMEKAWGTHAMVLDYPDKGDVIELVARKTLEVVGKYTVTQSEPKPTEWNTAITLSKPLPDDLENYYVINITRLPRLEFVNSYVGSHLARAVLVKTRNVLIENCTFKESTGTAIHIGAEGDWREGAGSENVTVRNNRILRCGRGDGTNDGATAIAINVKAPDVSVAGIHKNILIDGNLIEGENAECGISVAGASGVTIQNNVFSGCSKLILTKASEQVKMFNNYNGKIKIRPDSQE